MIKGHKYKFMHQHDILIYLGHNYSGNGYWHQFAKDDNPDIVCCELLDTDLSLLEEA